MVLECGGPTDQAGTGKERCPRVLVGGEVEGLVVAGVGGPATETQDLYHGSWQQRCLLDYPYRSSPRR